LGAIFYPLFAEILYNALLSESGIGGLSIRFERLLFSIFTILGKRNDDTTRRLRSTEDIDGQKNLF
jgi:hypothetical protein